MSASGLLLVLAVAAGALLLLWAYSHLEVRWDTKRHSYRVMGGGNPPPPEAEEEYEKSRRIRESSHLSREVFRGLRKPPQGQPCSWDSWSASSSRVG